MTMTTESIEIVSSSTFSGTEQEMDLELSLDHSARQKKALLKAKARKAAKQDSSAAPAADACEARAHDSSTTPSGAFE